MTPRNSGPRDDDAAADPAPPACPAGPDLEVRGLAAGYGGAAVLRGLDAVFPAGCITTVVGPNGCGKSTLLKAIARYLPSTGEILLGGEDARRIPRRAYARRLAVLPQSPVAPEGITVRELVSRGRHPHQRWFRQFSERDEAVVTESLRHVGLAGAGARRLDALSGGQRQRAWLAMTLAQRTGTLLLDEPTTYLDLAHSVSMLRLVRGLAGTGGATVVMVLHDLNLAARHSDCLLVLGEGEVAAAGPPAEVITPELLSRVFGLSAGVLRDPYSEAPLIVPR